MELIHLLLLGHATAIAMPQPVVAEDNTAWLIDQAEQFGLTPALFFEWSENNDRLGYVPESMYFSDLLTPNERDFIDFHFSKASSAIPAILVKRALTGMFICSSDLNFEGNFDSLLDCMAQVANRIHRNFAYDSNNLIQAMEETIQATSDILYQA